MVGEPCRLRSRYLTQLTQGGLSCLVTSINSKRVPLGPDGERKRLIRTLIKAARSQELRVSIVSGDVHVAAWGSIYRKDASPVQNWLRINQFTSTAVVHPSMNSFFERLFLGVLNKAATQEQAIDTEHGVEMMLFPGSSERVYGARNWLALELDDQQSPEYNGLRLWATWRCEGQDRPSNHLVAVHPYKPLAVAVAPAAAVKPVPQS